MNLVLKKISDEVFVADEPVVQLGTEQVSFLKTKAVLSKRKRARICAHRTNEDPVHEMLIAISAESYIHPHKHIQKTESFHIVEGCVDVVIFDDRGAILDVIELGDLSSGKNFYYRLSETYYHTLLIRSEFLVMHEVTTGPFVVNEALTAPFAPPENDYAAAQVYIKEVEQAALTHRLYKQERNTK